MTEIRKLIDRLDEITRDELLGKNAPSQAEIDRPSHRVSVELEGKDGSLVRYQVHKMIPTADGYAVQISRRYEGGHEVASFYTTDIPDARFYDSMNNDITADKAYEMLKEAKEEVTEEYSEGGAQRRLRHFLPIEAQNLDEMKGALINSMNIARKSNNIATAASLEMAIDHIDSAMRRMNIAIEDIGKDLD